MKKRSERRKHCALAVVSRIQKLSPRRRTPSRGRGTTKFNQLEPTDPAVLWESMHAISSYRGNRPTPKHRPPVANKQTGLITIHCAAKLSAQCKNLQTPSSGKIICFSNQVLVLQLWNSLNISLRRTAVHINSLFNKTTTTIFVSCSTCSHLLCLFYVTYSFISYADPTTCIWLQVLKSKLRVSKIINDLGYITLQSNKNHLHII